MKQYRPCRRKVTLFIWSYDARSYTRVPYLKSALRGSSRAGAENKNLHNEKIYWCSTVSNIRCVWTTFVGLAVLINGSELTPGKEDMVERFNKHILLKQQILTEDKLQEAEVTKRSSVLLWIWTPILHAWCIYGWRCGQYEETSPYIVASWCGWSSTCWSAGSSIPEGFCTSAPLIIFISGAYRRKKTETQSNTFLPHITLWRDLKRWAWLQARAGNLISPSVPPSTSLADMKTKNILVSPHFKCKPPCLTPPQVMTISVPHKLPNSNFRSFSPAASLMDVAYRDIVPPIPISNHHVTCA